jgi:hypothetical protein
MVKLKPLPQNGQSSIEGYSSYAIQPAMELTAHHVLTPSSPTVIWLGFVRVRACNQRLDFPQV